MKKEKDPFLNAVKQAERSRNRSEFIQNGGGAELITAGIGLAIAGGIKVYDFVKNRKKNKKK